MIFPGFMMYDLRFMIARCAALALWRSRKAVNGQANLWDGQIINHQS